MPDALRLEHLLRTAERMKNQRPRFPLFLVSPKVKAWMEYILDTIVVWEFRGARRMRGPDGKTWIEKKWRTANVAIGNGNKSKRRMGLVPVQGFFGDVKWEVPHASR